MLSDLLGLIRCDYLVFVEHDSSRQADWFGQVAPAGAGDGEYDDAAFWEHYSSSLPCSYPDRTGDLRGVTKLSDFYSARQWHSTGMYQDCYRASGIEQELMVCLPAGPGWAVEPGRTLRLILLRTPPG